MNARVLRPVWIGACGLTLTACGSGQDPADPLEPVDTTAAPQGPQPTVVASVPIPPNYGIHDTFVRDGIAFVCAWNTGVILFDVGNGIRNGAPSAPVEISRLVTETTAGFTGARAHNAWWFHNPGAGEKRYLFVGQEGPAVVGFNSTGDIHVVDVSDLANPVQVARYHMTGTSQPAGAHNFWMDETAQILYAAFYNGGVVALDVSGTLAGDLAGREIARIAPAAGATYIWGVHLMGGWLYAVDMLNGFYQLELAGGSLTVRTGGGNVTERFSSDLWVHGTAAYTGTWGTRGANPGNVVKVWDLSGGGAPTLADSVVLSTIGTVSDVQVSVDGKQLVFTSENGPGAGVHVYSLADPLHPAFTARHGLGDQGFHTGTVADIGGKRYVFTAKNPPDPQLVIYDITALIP